MLSGWARPRKWPIGDDLWSIIFNYARSEGPFYQHRWFVKGCAIIISDENAKQRVLQVLQISSRLVCV